mmetsp:Transcript_29289/g.41228  ORF Transcript_29289/g.41228 Transcript_29289/m.41228 type:complete len:516 (+) Transcript_29289:1598-3145(+)
MPKRRVTVDISHSDSEDEEESSGEQQNFEDGEYDEDEDFDSPKAQPSNLKINGTSVRRKSRSQHVTFSRSKSSSKTRNTSKNFKKGPPASSSSSDENSEAVVQPKAQPKKRLNGKHNDNDNTNKKTKSKPKLLPLYNSSDGESSSKSVPSSEKTSSHENGNHIALDQSGEMIIDDNIMESNSVEESVDTDNSVEHKHPVVKEKLRQGNKTGKNVNGLRKAVATKAVKLTNSAPDPGPQSDKSDPPSRRISRTTTKQTEDDTTNGSSSEQNNTIPVRTTSKENLNYASAHSESESEPVQKQQPNGELEDDDQSGADDYTAPPPPPTKSGKPREKTKRKKVMAKKQPAKKKVNTPSPQKKRKLFDPPSNLLEDIVFEGVEDDESEEEDMDLSQSFSINSQSEDVNGLSQGIKDTLVVKTDVSDAEDIKSLSLKSSSELDKSQPSQTAPTHSTLNGHSSIANQHIPGSPSEPHRNGTVNGLNNNNNANNTTPFKKQPSFRLQLPNMSIKVYCDDKNKS